MIILQPNDISQSKKAVQLEERSAHMEYLIRLHPDCVLVTSHLFPHPVKLKNERI